MRVCLLLSRAMLVGFALLSFRLQRAPQPSVPPAYLVAHAGLLTEVHKFSKFIHGTATRERTLPAAAPCSQGRHLAGT